MFHAYAWDAWVSEMRQEGSTAGRSMKNIPERSSDADLIWESISTIQRSLIRVEPVSSL